MQSELYLGMQSKQVTDGLAWDKKNKQTNTIQFECENRYVSYALNYFKKTYPSKWKDDKNTIPLGYNISFMVLVVL